MEAKTSKEGTRYSVLGTLVFLIEDNLPPIQWKIGRVIEIHPGDNVVRVAIVQTSSAIYKRVIRKLCALPHDIDNSRYRYSEKVTILG